MQNSSCTLKKYGKTAATVDIAVQSEHKSGHSLREWPLCIKKADFAYLGSKAGKSALLTFFFTKAEADLRSPAITVIMNTSPCEATQA